MRLMVDIRAADIADLDAVATCMREAGTQQATAERLQHWYFKNPSGSASLIGAFDGATCLGVATTNDHHFQTPDGKMLFAMPQKVLTSLNARGQGLFGRTFRAAEEACSQRGCDGFVTITNAASTPIFLERFGFQRAVSPKVVFLSPLLFSSLHISEIPSPDLTQVASIEDPYSMIRSSRHLAWRYHPDAFGMEGVRYFSVSKPDLSIGSFVMKRTTKGGFPLVMVMDLFPNSKQHIPAMIQAVRSQCLRERCVAVMLLQRPSLKKSMHRSWPRWTVSDRFNLLVKGKDQARTAQMATWEFAFSFGDLDFV